MTTKPGELYRVDLGIGGKVRLMVVVSIEDPDAPRALSACIPITTAFRESWYEVPMTSKRLFREKSYANVQGIQAVQHHELEGPLGMIAAEDLRNIRAALSRMLSLG